MQKVANREGLIDALSKRGPMSLSDMAAHFESDLPSISGLLNAFDDELVCIESVNSTVYALAVPIGRFAAQQPIWRIDVHGRPQQIGTLTFLAKSLIHVTGPGVEVIFKPPSDTKLPWFLSGIQAQGFLGRMFARSLAGEGLSRNPSDWGVSETLVAAIHTYDAPGALLVGDEALSRIEPTLPSKDAGSALDELASDVIHSLLVGSIAGGEQPKFLARGEQGEAYVVKFSPPRGTPFGDRWTDLLCAEEVCSKVLEMAGLPTAESRIVQTKSRTYLVSTRFDRTQAGGRTHVVSIGAAHQGFVKGNFQNWSETAEALNKLGMLPARDASLVDDLRQFGKLIGNTDMHSGNLGLYCSGHTLKEILTGEFKLAPVYDMLPMRWRPDATFWPNDYQSFEPDVTFANGNIRRAARECWATLSWDKRASHDFRAVAQIMSGKLARVL